MKVWKFFLCFMFLPQSLTFGEDTVAEDIGEHQLERLAELLTIRECEELLSALSVPEESIFHHLDRLSPNKNPLGLKPRVKRDTPASDDETQCQTLLTDWLMRNGEKTYYDRLSRALQHIGRTDIAIVQREHNSTAEWCWIEGGVNDLTEDSVELTQAGEGTICSFHQQLGSKKEKSQGKDRRTSCEMSCRREIGKNINQDKALSLKRNVEDYHKYVSSLKFPSVNADTKKPQHKNQRVRKTKGNDLDLISEKVPVTLYQRGPVDVFLPLLYGILLGFGGISLVGLSLLFVIIRFSQRQKWSHHNPMRQA